MDEFSDGRAIEAATSRNTANVGHGHVTPRPDGVKARCGGPAFCPVCARELAALNTTVPALPPTSSQADQRSRWLQDVYFLIGHAAIQPGTELPAALLEIAERIARAHVDEAHAQRCAEIAAKLAGATA